MEIKTLNVGEKVELRGRERSWEGIVLESHDPEVVLLKLGSGYNIGIRENSILSVKVLEKSDFGKKESEIKFEKKKGLRNVAVVVTGGTISARLDPKTGGTTWTTVEDLFKIAPDIGKICNIVKIEKPFMKASEDMAFKDYKKIAEVCEKLLNDSEIDGVIVTHGTDFLHYTASALSFFFEEIK